MSLEAVAWALKQRVGDPIAKLVLIGLANHHNESSGLCCPRRALLAVAADCDERTVIRKIKWLVAERWVTVEYRFEKGRQTTNAYRLVRVGNGGDTPSPSPELAEKVGGQPVTLPPKREDSEMREGDTADTLGGDTAVTPITVIGTKEKRRVSARENPTTVEAKPRPASRDWLGNEATGSISVTQQQASTEQRRKKGMAGKEDMGRARRSRLFGWLPCPCNVACVLVSSKNAFSS